MLSEVLSDHIQLWGFEDDFIIFSDSSLGFGLSLLPLDALCWDDTKAESVSERLRHFLNGLPSGIHLQFVLDIGGGNQTLLNHHQALITGATGIANELAKERVERFIALEQNRLLPKYTPRLFVRRPIDLGLKKKAKLFSGRKQFERIAEDTLAVEISKTQKVRADIIQSLKASDILTMNLEVNDIAQLFYDQWNPSRSVPMPQFTMDDFRSELLFSDVSIYEKGFSIADTHHRVLSLKRLPDNTFATMATKLTEMPFGSRTFLTVETVDQEKELSKLQLQRRFAFAMAHGKSGMSDIESESKYHDLESLLEGMIAGGQKVFRMSLNTLLRSTSADELNSAVSDSLIALRELSGAGAMEETIAAFDVFLDFSLPNARCYERAKLIDTANLANFLPLFAPWAGHEKPSILLRSRLGNLMAFDPFSPDLTNANQIVTGGSGAGKSFLANLLLLQMLKEQ